ncbi:hypothetical protein G6F65_020802 [Rhizopus arrhizus]|nr:hypothetical protein G6F65_020802 [Rhizopus arrhizus]
MQRAREEGAARSLFDDLAQIHHRDVVADVLDHGHVVRNEQERLPLLPLDPPQQVQNLRADGNVQRRHRLIAHDQVRRAGQRPGHVQALPLPTGKLVRKQLALFGPQPHQFKHCGHARFAPAGRVDAHQVQRRPHNVFGALARVQ